MKKFVIILAALMLVMPLVGCSGGEEEDAGPVTLPDGTTPNPENEGDNNAAGGAESETPL